MTQILKLQLNPNQLYALATFKKSMHPIRINDEDIRLLKLDGFLNNNHTLTPKGELAIKKIEDYLKGVKTVNKTNTLGDNWIEKVNEYRELFPKIILPSGVPARINVKDIEKKFIWFKITYPQYSWDIILTATKKYVEEYERQGYGFMKNSGFFISKQDNNKVITSELATRCEMLLEDDDVISSPLDLGFV